MTDLLDKNYKYLLLSQCYLFCDLSIDELDQLSVNAKIRKAEANEVIFNKNDKGSEMFVIANGKVALSTVSDQGKKLQFGTLGEGDIFGEISLFDNQERTATITAIEPTQLLIIEKAPFVDFMMKNPQIALKLLAAMAARLRYTDQIYEDTVFGPLHVRLAKKLLELAKLFGEEVDGHIKITIALTEKEIAKMLGASLDHVIKQIAFLQSKGWIRVARDQVIITDQKQLSAHCA